MPTGLYPLFYWDSGDYSLVLTGQSEKRRNLKKKKKWITLVKIVLVEVERWGTWFSINSRAYCISLLGYHNKIPQTGCCKQQNLFSYNAGGWKFKISVSAWLGSSENAPLCCRQPPSYCALTQTFVHYSTESKLSSIFFTRTLILWWEHHPRLFPKASSPNSIT